MQAQAACPASELIFYGCQMSGLPQNHNCIQPRSDGSSMQGMFYNPMHANRR